MKIEELTSEVFNLCKDIPELYDIRVITTSRGGFPTFKPTTHTRVVVGYGTFGENNIEEYFFENHQEVSMNNLKEKLAAIKVSPLVEILSKASQI